MNNNKKNINFYVAALLNALPLAILVGLYVILDPFKVVRKYDTYYVNDGKPCAFLNNDYVSTSTYDRWKESCHYDSFIWGNSMSRLFRIEDWKTHLPEGSSCLHFDASGEPLYGIWKKVMYVDKQGSDIRNVMVVMTSVTLEGDCPNEGHIYMISPQLEDNKNFWKFQKESFMAFCTPKFFYAYLCLQITGEIPEYAKKQNLFLLSKDTYDNITNEGTPEIVENKIKEGTYYTQEFQNEFNYTDEQGVEVPYIKEEQILMLRDIKKVFDKHNTDYKIVICPVIGSNSINPNDYDVLAEIFGEDNVFDFTHRDSFSLDYTNFYMDGHIRPKGTKVIMDRIYGE